jgi:p38 MAP kinase
LDNLPNFEFEEVTLPMHQALDFGEFLNCGDPQLVDLIAKMLVYNPRERITALNALKHPYFEKVAAKTREICLPPQFNQSTTD